MLSARTMFQKATVSIPAMQHLIERFKNLLSNNPDIADKAKNVFQTVMDVKQHTQTSSHHENYAHQGTNFLGKLIGPAGLFLLNALSAEAMPAGIIVKSGSNGGVDLCSGTYWCIQATLNNASTNEVLAQACRKIGIAGAGGSQFTEWAISSEFNDEMLKQVLVSTLDAAPDWYTNLPTECSPQTALWMGTQVTGSAKNLSPDGCEQFKNFFEDASNKADNWRTYGKAVGLYLATIVAAALVCSCCYCGLLLACDADERPRLA